MPAVKAQVFEEEQATEHAVAFGTVGPRVKAWNGTLATDDADGASRKNPAGGTLEMVGRAIAHKPSVGSGREQGIDVKRGLVCKMDALKEHALPGIEGEKVVRPGLAEDDGLFAGAGRGD